LAQAQILFSPGSLFLAFVSFGASWKQIFVIKQSKKAKSGLELGKI
jgi:hypothetical protein